MKYKACHETNIGAFDCNYHVEIKQRLHLVLLDHHHIAHIPQPF
jgi:hypothetical protein